MTANVNLSVPDDLMEWLALCAARDFRTPGGQLLWLLREARKREAQAEVKKEAQHMVDPDALKVLLGELRDLHLEAGLPSTRIIAERARLATGKRVAHTTVHTTLRATTLPSWVILERMVAGLGGDVERFRELWIRARSGRQDPLR